MNVNHYIGFDVHKKSISYCVKTADGTIVEESTLRATHLALREWAQKRREPWHGAMEATLFSGWIYDALKPYAVELQMGHPTMMKAIGASKKKNDKLDARKTADLVRCNLLPVCYVAPRGPVLRSGPATTERGSPKDRDRDSDNSSPTGQPWPPLPPAPVPGSRPGLAVQCP